MVRSFITSIMIFGTSWGTLCIYTEYLLQNQPRTSNPQATEILNTAGQTPRSCQVTLCWDKVPRFRNCGQNFDHASQKFLGTIKLFGSLSIYSLGPLFVWLAIGESLTTEQRLKKWGLTSSNPSKFYSSESQTGDHLSFTCPTTESIEERIQHRRVFQNIGAKDLAIIRSANHATCSRSYSCLLCSPF